MDIDLIYKKNLSIQASLKALLLANQKLEFEKTVLKSEVIR